MADFDQIRNIKEKAEARLRTFPGVHAVGIGEKYVNGKGTGETAIVVLVVEKKAREHLKPEDVVPAEIDGIKTDVIQVPMPRLHMAANPSNLQYSIIDEHTIKFSGKNNPGAGLVLTVEFDVTPTTAFPPHFAFALVTYDSDQLADIAQRVAAGISGDGYVNGQTATSEPTSGGVLVIVTPPTDGTATITGVTIKAVDDAQYFDKWVRGGVRIGLANSGFGTLGCLATAVSADDPQGKIVALTNHHVVEPVEPGWTNLTVQLNSKDSTQVEFISTDGNSIVPNTLVAIGLSNDSVDPPVYEDALYLTVEGNSAADAAQKIEGVITQLAIDGVVAQATVATLTITGITPVPGVSGPIYNQGTFAANASTDYIVFNGAAVGDDCGIFVDIHPGGALVSFGVFVNPPDNTDGAGMAGLVVAAFQNLPSDIKGNVTVRQTGNRIDVINAAEIEARTTNDIRVGQPDASFGSSCCECCSHRIGRVIDAKLDADAAIIQLDPGLHYKPEIQDIGLMKGFESPKKDMAVYKRGSSTQNTTSETVGFIWKVNVTGQTSGSPRQYKNAIMVISSDHRPISVPGDSGSAIVNVASGKVVALNWGGDETYAIATPIDQVIAAFPKYTFDFAPAPASGQAPDAVRTVPKPAAQMQAAPESLAQGARAMTLTRRLQDRLLDAEKEIAAVPAGKEYAELIRHHFAEGQRLVNGNRRVATAWHRNGGPELLQAIFRILQRPDQRLPKELNGKPLTECLQRMLRVMARYASPRFSADLQQHAPRLAGLAGLSFNDMLSILQSWSGGR